MNKNLRLVTMSINKDCLYFSVKKKGKGWIAQQYDFDKKINTDQAFDFLLDFCDKYNFEFVGLFYKHKETCIYAVREKGIK